MPTIADQGHEFGSLADRKARAFLITKNDLISDLLKYYKGVQLEGSKEKNLISFIQFTGHLLRNDALGHAISDTPQAINDRTPLVPEEIDAIIRSFQSVEDLIHESIFPKEIERMELELESKIGEKIGLLRSKVNERQGIEDDIFKLLVRSPGLYIKQIYFCLAKATYNVSYSTIHNAVERLVRENRLLTVGGAQGRPRFCFPHPTVVEPSRYYGKLFAAEGVLIDEMGEIELSGTGRFQERFLIQDDYKYYLAVPLDAIDPSAQRIRTFGRLIAPKDGQEVPTIQSIMVEYILNAEVVGYWVDRTTYSTLVSRAREEIVA